MGLSQRCREPALEEAGTSQRFDQSRRIARNQQSRMRRGFAQHQVLQQEFQIDQATRALLEVESRGIAAIQFGAHLQAHLADFLDQLERIARLGQGLRADRIEFGQQ